MDERYTYEKMRDETTHERKIKNEKWRDEIKVRKKSAHEKMKDKNPPDEKQSESFINVYKYDAAETTSCRWSRA